MKDKLKSIGAKQLFIYTLMAVLLITIATEVVTGAYYGVTKGFHVHELIYTV